jgi:transcriptional regulator with XRE-family HTH domain
MTVMAHAQTHGGGPPAIGVLLQYWRRARNLSQLALAHVANVSPRHVSFVETGRARPSRDMVLLLTDALAVPLRERNAFLLAAGFAPMFRESALDEPELAPVRTAIDAILKQQEPYPAVVMNRRWDIVATNEAATRFFGMLLDGRTPPCANNVLRLMFHPDGLRPSVENWNTVAQALVHRVHREAVGGALEDAGRQLLSEVLGYPGVPPHWRTPDLGAPLIPVVPVSFRYGDHSFHFFSAVTVLGTPQDITLQELRVECFFPLDDATAAAARNLLARAEGSTRAENIQTTEPQVRSPLTASRP